MENSLGKKQQPVWLAGGNSERLAMPLMPQVGAELIGTCVLDTMGEVGKYVDSIQALAQRYAMPAVVSWMDLSLEAEALGASVVYRKNSVPYVDRRLLHSPQDIVDIQFAFCKSGRIPLVLQAAERLAVCCDIPVIFCCTGPLTLASVLYGMDGMKGLIQTDPDSAHRLLEKCLLFLSDFGHSLKESGAGGLLVAEPVAGLLNGADCWTFSSCYVARMVSQLQREHWGILLHNCGNRGECTRAMVATGAAGIHIGNCMDICQVFDECPENRWVAGNLDPVGVWKNSPSDKVYEATDALLRRTSAHPNFLISTGCDVPYGVPLENVDAFFRAVDDFNRKR